MFAILLFSVVTIPFATEFQDAAIPEKYRGIWRLVGAVDEDGKRTSSDDAGFAKSNPIEILIVGNRVIHVNDDGSSVMAYATVMESKTGLTLDLRTGIAHDKARQPTYWNLELTEGKLTIELAVDRYKNDPRENRNVVPSFEAVRRSR